MAALVDTNVLIRFLDRRSTDHSVCVEALRVASNRPGEFFICLQVAIEFWSVATRPLDVNGLALKPAEAEAALSNFEKFLPMLAEPADIALRWRGLVIKYGVSGRASHDARIVALMEGNGMTDILTINASDFSRYPGIRIVSPQQIAGK